MSHMNLHLVKVTTLPPNTSVQGCDSCKKPTEHSVERNGGITEYRCRECGAKWVRCGAVA